MGDDDNAFSPEREGEGRFPEGYLNAIRRYFIAGLLVVVPIWGTYLALRTLFKTLDGVLGNLLKGWGIYYLPGFGIRDSHSDLLDPPGRHFRDEYFRQETPADMG